LVAIWVPIVALYGPNLSRDSAALPRAVWEEALLLWLPCWGLLVVLALAELAVHRFAFGRRISADGFVVVAVAVLMACVVVAIPLWFVAEASLDPSP
jgi:hypothetical protein